MRESFLPYALPFIGEEEIAEVADTLRSGWLSSGPKVKQFEQDFAEYTGAAHAIAVSSCTAALHIALTALGIKPGDEVIVPAITFCATANVVAHLGARPVVVDVDEHCHISLQAIDGAITARTRAVVPVHYAGQACDLNPILALASAHGIAVVEDAAHAAGSEYDGRRIGTHGRAAAFSFYATKNMTTGEGGMITTNDGDFAARMRQLALHGMSRDAWNRYGEGGSWAYDVVAAGYKDNLSDLASALGLTQLEKSDRFHARRRAIARAYDEGLADIEGVETPQVADFDGHAWHLYVLQVDARDRFIAELAARGIGTSVHFIPLHHLSHYRERYRYKPSDFPEATAAFERLVSLPIYPRMTDADVARVIEAVRDVAQEVRS